MKDDHTDFFRKLNMFPKGVTLEDVQDVFHVYHSKCG